MEFNVHVVTALRGVRGRKSGSEMKDLANVNFDFVPEGESYESYYNRSRR